MVMLIDRLFILILLAFFNICLRGDTIVVLVQPLTAASCADCSGTASFIWGCDDADVTYGVAPDCGCSDGDTTGTLQSQATISSGSVVLNDTSANGYDRYLFDNGADGLCDDSIGTIFIRFVVTTWVDDIPIFVLYGDANNKIVIETKATLDIKASHIGNTDSDVVQPATTLSEGTDYILRYRYSVAAANPDNSLTIFDSAMSEIATDEDDDNLTAFATEAGDGDFIIGNNLATASSNISIRYVHVYKEWLDTDPNITQVP